MEVVEKAVLLVKDVDKKAEYFATKIKSNRHKLDNLLGQMEQHIKKTEREITDNKSQQRLQMNIPKAPEKAFNTIDQVGPTVFSTL